MIKITNFRFVTDSGRKRKLSKAVERTVMKFLKEKFNKRYKRTTVDFKVV